MSKLREVAPGLMRFKCPGCGGFHDIPVRSASEPGSQWIWNGSVDRPTLTPSVLARSGHYIDPGSCWCKYYSEHPEKTPHFKCGICHSFVTDGYIQYLTDCTHALAGQTVALPDIEE